MKTVDYKVSDAVHWYEKEIVMAVRLPILLIQTRPPDAASERLVDDVIGQLIGSNGMDLILIDRLNDLPADAIDRLTLESLQGDLAILDWNTAASIGEAWRYLGLSGSRAPHSLDAGAETVKAGERRLYLIDLALAESSEAVLSVLRTIQAGRKVATFSLGLPSTTEAGEQAMGHRGDGGLSPQKNNSSSSRIEVNSDDTSNVLSPSDAVLGVESAVTPGLIKDSGSIDPDPSETEARVEERTHGGQAFNDGQKRTNPDRGAASEGLGTPKSVGHTGFATKNELDLEALIDELDQSDL